MRRFCLRRASAENPLRRHAHTSDIPARDVTQGSRCCVRSLPTPSLPAWELARKRSADRRALGSLAAFLVILNALAKRPRIRSRSFRMRTLRGADTFASADRHVAFVDVLSSHLLYAAVLHYSALRAVLPSRPLSSANHPVRPARIVGASRALASTT